MRFRRSSPVWPDGFTWVFQGTIAEDATAGTHVCTLTVTPNIGNEMQLLYAEVVAGAGAANITDLIIDDGTNELTRLLGVGVSLASGNRLAWPTPIAATAQALSGTPQFGTVISGTMRVFWRISTATVSLTHTFSMVARMRFSLRPSATLLDTIGTSTNTINTNALFG